MSLTPFLYVEHYCEGSRERFKYRLPVDYLEGAIEEKKVAEASSNVSNPQCGGVFKLFRWLCNHFYTRYEMQCRFCPPTFFHSFMTHLLLLLGTFIGRAHPVTEYRLEDVLQLTGYEVQEDSDYALKENTPRKFSKSALRKMYYPKYTTRVIHSLSIVNENVINYELLASLLEHIATNEEEGAILVFMPGMSFAFFLLLIFTPSPSSFFSPIRPLYLTGMMEITKAIDELRKSTFFQSDEVILCPLHSSLSTFEQTAVFDVPPEGVRKIVIATNIAETSITIEDVVYVVDCGRVKENRKDEINETPTLVECWVSRASAKQRRGRAGRVRPGISVSLSLSLLIKGCTPLLSAQLTILASL